MSKQVYLASQSPRRLELLRQIGLAPVILPLRNAAGRVDVDETPMPEEQAFDYVQRLARAKAEAALQALVGRHLLALPIITADTTVTIDGSILGKPRDAQEAAAMLRRYSGRSHSVLTAVGVAHRDAIRVAVSESVVLFRPLGDPEIAAYVATPEPFDKAGGYGIQGHAAIFIANLSGSYSGVMGLPLYETAELLREAGFSVL